MHMFASRHWVAKISLRDFTNGAWATNAPVELTLKGGGTTGVKELKKAEIIK
jgi:hypothetical protein